MKKRDWRTSLQIVMTLCALWGWWGMLYPEFTLTQDTYRVVYEEDDARQSMAAESASARSTTMESGTTADGEAVDEQADAEIAEESPRELYWRLLQAPKGQIRFRSKLLMQLQKWMEQ